MENKNEYLAIIILFYKKDCIARNKYLLPQKIILHLLKKNLKNEQTIKLFFINNVEYLKLIPIEFLLFNYNFNKIISTQRFSEVFFNYSKLNYF